jgi:hypothetical protein
MRTKVQIEDRFRMQPLRVAPAKCKKFEVNYTRGLPAFENKCENLQAYMAEARDFSKLAADFPSVISEVCFRTGGFTAFFTLPTFTELQSC